MSADRFLWVRGPSTALRLALPAVGELSLGSGPAADVRVEEAELNEIHLSLYLDDGIGVRTHAAGVCASDGEEIAPGRAVDLSPSDVLRIGEVELGFLLETDQGVVHRTFARAHVELRLANATPPPSVLVLEAGDVADPGLEAQLLDRLGADAVLSDLGDGSTGVVLFGIGRVEAEGLMATLLHELGPRFPRFQIGLAHGGEVEPAQMFELAKSRQSRPDERARGNIELRSNEPAMKKVLALVDQVAKSNAHLLILGETGVGKDLLAQTIHARSDRAQLPLIRINCIDMPESFLSATDAGLLQRASGGTILLDDVSALHSRAQLSLGTRLEEIAAGRYDVRFMAISNHDLNVDVARGAFKKDLIFRLGQVSITMPPLRDRPGDVVKLAEQFIRSTRPDKPPRIDEEAAAVLRSYPWPGNVRELRNVIDRALMLSAEVLGVDALPAELSEFDHHPVPGSEELDPESTANAPISASGGARAPGGGGLREEIEALERARITEALEKYPTQTEAAKALGVPLRTFLNRLDALGIPRARKSK